MAGYIAIAVAIVVILIPIIIYNRLIALEQTRQDAFADIDVQLKQRCDLVPNLVETVKGNWAEELGNAKRRSRHLASSGPVGALAFRKSLGSCRRF